MPVQKRLGGLRRIGLDEAAVAVGQVDDEAVGLLLHAADDHQGLAEVALRVARRVGQRDEHLPGLAAILPDVVLDCGVSAVVAVLVPERVDSGREQNRTLRLLSALWPPVFAGEQDVGPPKGRDVGQELGLDRQPGVFPLSNRFAEMGGIPVPTSLGNEA